MNKTYKIKSFAYTNHLNNKSRSPLINGKVKVIYGGTTGKPYCLACHTELCMPEIERKKCVICKMFLAFPGEYEKDFTWDEIVAQQYLEK